MKKTIACLTILTAIIIACNTGKKNGNLLSKPDDIVADEYVINIDKDTTLQTKNGALLKIPKGALATDNGNTVVLEIKEAYSMEQMILAGLTTQSDGRPLSSGGMIYINAKGGENVTIKQAIKVALPADYLNPDMQLFKGETDKEGNVNWTTPTALPENKQLTSIEKGKRLFETKCAGCHSIGKDKSGPDLAHFPKRIPYGEGSSKYWYHDFSNIYIPIRYHDKDYGNPDSLFKEAWVDPYACNLINMYGGKAINLSSEFNTDTSSTSGFEIYNYIQNESERLNIPYPQHTYLKGCTDSCDSYKNRITNLQNDKELLELKKKLQVQDNGKLTKEKRDTILQPAPPEPITKTPPQPPPPVNFDEVVSPENNEGIYYQFSIETFGWYNVDVLLKDVTGNQESELTVRIIGAYKEKLDIFLIIPEQKIYTKAGKKKSGTDEFVFAYTNGKIFLPQNAKAYILGMTESKSSIAFSLFQFTTGLKQNIEMELKSSTKEIFNEAITSISGNGIKISVTDSKNAESIRKTEGHIEEINKSLKDAEKLKPKNCDCNCGQQPKKDISNMLEVSK